MDETLQKQTRDITKTLADLDVYFTVGADPKGVPTWSIPFAPETAGQEGIVVNLQLLGGWVAIYHQVGASVADKVPPEMLRELLELNGRLAIAKVAFDQAGNFGVTAQVAVSRLSPETLREAITAVLNGAKETRDLLGISSGGTPPVKH